MTLTGRVGEPTLGALSGVLQEKVAVMLHVTHGGAPEKDIGLSDPIDFATF
ncbi:MAG: hypothetical protein JXR43_00375 [Burkholderiaceae bacterium]|nr:hypothetical protein [Burkholderiaceae bacterium]